MHAEAGSCGVSGGEIRASIWSGKGDSSVEARLDSLEKNVQRLRDEQGIMEKQLEQEKTTRLAEVTAEREARESAICELDNTLSKLGAENIRMERWGVLWLLISLVFQAWT